ncbi:MAG: UvrD-helicase domain-containing protein [Anaerolineae bacterium]
MAVSTLYGYALREHQQAILAYSGGLMGVSAVPGSGKTLTLALLAARLIIEGRIGEAGEVLVVTVQNSAVDNISRRIKGILQSQRLPSVGYQVCTLHRLAADILRIRNDVAGVEDSFAIIDDGERSRLMAHAANTWIAGHAAYWESLVPNLDGNVRQRWLDLTIKIGLEAAKSCKHLRLSPEQARLRARRVGIENDFALLGLELYAGYQNYLGTQNALDFDDLIWRAIDALEDDASYAAGLRQRWPFILEDEAQDSSPLQENILRHLAGGSGNWVRMGDPNQSINATFTTADPLFFRRFLADPAVKALALPESGRSAQPVIDLANSLVHWVSQEHPEPEIRKIAFEEQDIRPTRPGDPQPNPLPAESHVRLVNQPFADLDALAHEVVKKAVEYGSRHPHYSQAILCPTNHQGAEIIKEVEQYNPLPPFDDLLRSTPQTRQVAGLLVKTLEFLSRPNTRTQTALYEALAKGGYLGEEQTGLRLRAQKAIIGHAQPERLFFPMRTDPWYAALPSQAQPLPGELPLLQRYTELVVRWLKATVMPADQLLITISQDLFQAEADLAISHVLAGRLRSLWQIHPEWRLNDYTLELAQIAQNKRGLPEIAFVDAGYEPRAGRTAVTTMHKAKGLEWDVVYLICVDTLEFPDTSQDDFRSEPFYMPERAPELETSVILEQLLTNTTINQSVPAIVQKTREEQIAERLRLLYVAITRARRDLYIAFAGTSSRRPVRLPLALRALTGGIGREH